ncbi:hypothetical protein GQR58_004075 [Nymphon striatum]|nr:hypothetical protein GQR58_004075 [Nymphon striatum]
MWSITSPPRRQSTPRFPNSGITSTGMPKQWPSSAMTTRQSLPFREMLPSAVNNGRPGLSRPAMPSTTRELMIVRSLPVHVLQSAHALQALYPLSHIDRARPRQPPTAAEPRRQQLGDSGQNRPTSLSQDISQLAIIHEQLAALPRGHGTHIKRVPRRRNTPLLPGTHTRRARRRRNAILLHFGRHLGNPKKNTRQQEKKNEIKTRTKEYIYALR